MFWLVDRATRSLARFMAGIAMVLMLVMALHVAASVGQRLIFGRDIPLTIELTSYYYMVTLTFLPLAFIELRNGHIRADLFSKLFTPKVSLAAEILTQTAMVVFLSFLTWRTFENALERTLIGESIVTTQGFFPIWLPRWCVPFGLAVAALFAALLVVRHLAVLLGRADPGAEPDRSEG